MEQKTEFEFTIKMEVCKDIKDKEINGKGIASAIRKTVMNDLKYMDIIMSGKPRFKTTIEITDLKDKEFEKYNGWSNYPTRLEEFLINHYSEALENIELNYGYFVDILGWTKGIINFREIAKGMMEA